MRWFELTTKEKVGRIAIIVLGYLAMYFKFMQTEVTLVIWISFLLMHDQLIKNRMELEDIKADIEKLKKHHSD